MRIELCGDSQSEENTVLCPGARLPGQRGHIGLVSCVGQSLSIEENIIPGVSPHGGEWGGGGN